VTWTSGVATLVDKPPDAGTSDAPQADSGELTSALDAGASDSPQADASAVTSAIDAGAADTPEADAGELALDAEAPDLSEGNNADALPETAQ
jgi:hypothetical protein